MAVWHETNRYPAAAGPWSAGMSETEQHGAAIVSRSLFRPISRRCARSLYLNAGGLVLLALLAGVACGEPAPVAGKTPPPPTTSPAEPESSLPRTTERAADRERMVARQIASRGVSDERVLDAMRNVPRHWFVPRSARRRAYQDSPLPIGHRQTISQPYIVALMTEWLELEPGQKVLEIGTGSGYQAAVLAELTDQVFTIEIVKPLAQRTRKLLQEKGYTTIQTRIGDGYRGWPDEAPFDAIIVTCAPEEPPRPLTDQLAVGGRMCIPVGRQGTTQRLILLRKRPDGTLKQERTELVRFVPMTGEAQNGGR